MSKLPNQCPSCSTTLQITRLGCADCKTQLEGEYELPALLRLPPDELTFVSDFVLASGSLKEMARIRKQSYPTIRNQLNKIIKKVQDNSLKREMKQHEILDAISKGELTVEQGAKLLKETTS